MTTTVLVTPDAPRFAPGRYVALPPIPCRTCAHAFDLAEKAGTPLLDWQRAAWSRNMCDCTDGTEPLTECLIATPGTECETCDGLGVYMVDGPSGEPVPAGWCPDCTNGQRPGVVLGRATFGAGLPIVDVYHSSLDEPHIRSDGDTSWLVDNIDMESKSADWSLLATADCLGDWAVGNVAYPIESYTLVTDPGGCPAGCENGWFGEPGGPIRTTTGVLCRRCRGKGHLTAPWSPPWLPTEPGVHRVEVEG